MGPFPSRADGEWWLGALVHRSMVPWPGRRAHARAMGRGYHLDLHPDGDIYSWITNGLPGGMPVWGTKLTDTERWELVNYLRSINGGRPSADAARGGAATADVGPGVVIFGLPLTFGGLGAGFVVRAARLHRARRRG